MPPCYPTSLTFRLQIIKLSAIKEARMETQILEVILEVEDDSLESAYEQAEAKVPEGLSILSREILSDGKVHRSKGFGDTMVQALEVARHGIPAGAEIIRETEHEAPQRIALELLAFDEQNAREQAEANTSTRDRIEAIELKSQGTRGFLGVGKKPNCYKVVIFHQAVAEVVFKEKARIRVRIGKELTYVASCNLCSPPSVVVRGGRGEGCGKCNGTGLMTLSKWVVYDSGKDYYVCGRCGAHASQYAPPDNYVSDLVSRGVLSCPECGYFGFKREQTQLTAKPISRERMDLLWMDAEELEVLVEGRHEVFLGPEKGGPKKLLVTKEDVGWAKQVDKVAARAAEASARGDFAIAIILYRDALELAPGADIYLMSIGSCYANMGQPRNALPCLERAHQISPNNQRIARNLRALRKPEAGEWFDKGNSLGQSGRFEEAVRYYDKVLEIDPQHDEAWYSKGTILSQLGRFDEAIRCYDRAIEIDPHNSEAWNNKGASLSQSGRFEEAVPCFDRAIEINPQNAGAWLNKAVAEEKLGRRRDAASSYRQFIALAPPQFAAQVDFAHKRLRELE